MKCAHDFGQIVVHSGPSWLCDIDSSMEKSLTLGVLTFAFADSEKDFLVAFGLIARDSLLRKENTCFLMRMR
jgi:hypothetical protein